MVLNFLVYFLINFNFSQRFEYDIACSFVGLKLFLYFFFFKLFYVRFILNFFSFQIKYKIPNAVILHYYVIFWYTFLKLDLISFTLSINSDNFLHAVHLTSLLFSSDKKLFHIVQAILVVIGSTTEKKSYLRLPIKYVFESKTIESN